MRENTQGLSNVGSKIDDEPRVRIGELSRRVGVSADRLRAWERRYGLLQPLRSPGGFRLYSRADERRVRAMQTHLAAGSSAAQAAAAAVAEAAAPAPAGDWGAALSAALARLDAARAHAAVDRLLGELGADRAMRDVILPFLRELGERWARAEIHVGQEHFASGLLHARLASLLRGAAGAGPLAVLACAPGELHTIGLVAFGVALGNRDWRVVCLGADTPVASLRRACDAARPAAVVVSAVMPARFADALDGMRALAADFPLAIGGAGAGAALAKRIGAVHLDGDPVTSAARVAAAGGLDA
jgi:MerR family transcriptional regulator, light-induced transcriptional regulator